MSKFKNKYRVESARAQWWDYGKKAAYFITICTKGGEPYFGTVENEQMRLFPTGVLADVLWYEIPHHFPHVFLGNHVVMPNHMHGILVLESLDKSKNMGQAKDNLKKDNTVETGHALSQSKTKKTPNNIDNSGKNPGNNRFQNIGKNTVSSIVGSYKSAVSKHANRLELPHGWQVRFHDRIIRSDQEYRHISNYIEMNPSQWKNDKFYEDF